MTTKERLQAYKNRNDPNYQIRVIIDEAVSKADLPIPKNGYTPIKGKDYWTDIEIQSVISYVMSIVKNGKDGLPGEQGIQGVAGFHGRDGSDGNHGRDGKDGSDGISPSVQSIVDEVVNSLPDVEYHKIKGAPDIKELKDLVAFLKLGGFRGGGSSSSGSTITSIYNEIVAGSGTTFTLANTPIVGSERIFALGQRLTGGGIDYTIIGAGITTINSWNAGQILADYNK